jgi:sulfate transport system permease protein
MPTATEGLALGRSTARHAARPRKGRSTAERLLIGAALVFSLLFLVVPLALIFSRAFSAGAAVYLSNIMEPATRHAIWLTVLTALVVVPINMGFGISPPGSSPATASSPQAAHHLHRDPFSVSPIVAGVTYLFLYVPMPLRPDHRQWASKSCSPCRDLPRQPLRHRPLRRPRADPAHADQGGETRRRRSRWGPTAPTFFFVTLPNIRWALLYGAVLCNARVMASSAPSRWSRAT